MKPRLVSVKDRNGDFLLQAEKPAPVLRDRLNPNRGPMATRYHPQPIEKPLADYSEVDWIDRMLVIAIAAVGCSLVAMMVASLL